MEKVKNILKKREMNILVPLIIVCIVTTILAPQFASKTNVLDLLRSISFSVITAVGMTFVITSGNLDLSVGSTLTISGMCAGLCLTSGIPTVPSILIAMGLAVLIGTVNGFLSVKVGMPSIIATLGISYISKGIVFVVSRGTPYYPFPDSFNIIGQGKLGALHYSIIIAAVITLFFGYVLYSTKYGRVVFALGGNREATRLAGINVDRYMMSIYILCSALAGFVGILTASRMGTAVANAGEGKDLMIAAGVIIGGTSFTGGVGTMVGTVIGASLMEVLTNALVMVHISAYWQNVLIGALMILAVSLDTIRTNPKFRKRRRKA